MQILRQIASGLAAAHAKVIVHRDLKPTNIMLVNDADLRGGERVKLLDSGIAKIVELDVEQEQSALTATDALFGTPTYMSPEQCRNPRDVTDRTDVYSLGVIAYEMLTGHQPFRASSEIDTIMRHKQLVPPPASDLNPSIPSALATLVASMLAKSPMERPEAAIIKHKLTQILQMPAASGEHAPIIPSSLVAAVPAGLISSGSHRAVALAQSGERPVPAVFIAPGGQGSGSAVPALSAAPGRGGDADRSAGRADGTADRADGAPGSFPRPRRPLWLRRRKWTASRGQKPRPWLLKVSLPVICRTRGSLPRRDRGDAAASQRERERSPARVSSGLLDAPTAPPIARDKLYPQRRWCPGAATCGSLGGQQLWQPGGGGEQQAPALADLAILLVAATFSGLYVLFGH